MRRIARIGIAALLSGVCCLAGCASQGAEGNAVPEVDSSAVSSSDAAVSAEDEAPDPDGSSTAVAAPDASETSGMENSQKGDAENMIDATTASVTAELNGIQFPIELADNDTAAAFAQMLPLQAEMTELNGNEKYLYLEGSLPANPTNPGTIEAGDVMLYGDNCLVVFYESHPTSYSYTRIGTVVDAAGLAEAVGAGSISASFALE